MGGMTTTTLPRLSTRTLSRTGALAALALAVGAVAGCSSGTNGDAATPPANADASVTATETASADDFTAAPGGPSMDESVHTAIDTAVGQMPGSRAFDLEKEDDGNAYEIDVTDGTTVTEVRISADGTSVQRTSTSDLDDDDRRELQAATIEMAEAIDIALGRQGGVITDVELDTEDGVVVWEVQVRASDDAEHDFDIDAATGEVLKVDVDR